MTLIKVFLTFVKIGAFSFGGGYAVLAFIEREIVGQHGWLKPRSSSIWWRCLRSRQGP